MAAAALSTSAIDLRAQNSHPIRLGKSILSPNDAPRWASVRYNHKPSLKAGTDVSATILPGPSAGTSKAELRDGDEEWKYNGTHSQAEETYVLVVSKDEAVLERVEDVYTYNLAQAPDEADATRLARKYSHIPATRPTDANDNDEADSSNPFDFRHFLKAAEAKRDEALAKSTAGTPLLHSRAATSTPSALKPRPAPAAAPAKRKAPATKTTTASKRVRAGQDPTPKPTSTTNPRPKPIPSVRLDRKASIRHPPPTTTANNNDEDDGELILENSTSTSTKQSSMHLALSGAFAHPSPAQGPISLRSAASSPASPAVTTSRQQEGQQVYEFDMGSDDEAEPEANAGISHEFEFDNSDDEDAGGGEEDGDVEEFELPSPVQENQARSSGQAPAAVEEEDDMEAQLALAFEAEAAAPVVGVAEESEEDVSEEE